jgi:hypothetical protein
MRRTAKGSVLQLLDCWYRTKITGPAIVLESSRLFGEKCPLLERLKTEGNLWGTNNVREWILKVCPETISDP